MRRRELGVVAVVLALVLGVVTRHFGLTDAAAWQRPVEFSGDALIALSSVVNCQEQGLGCVWGEVTPRLGAPAGADWADFPRTEDALFLAGGLAARVVGPAAALDGLLVLAALVSAAAMYVVARAFRAHPALAAAVAVLFACSPFFFTRGVQHLALSWDGLVPLSVLAWWRVGARRRRGFVLLVSALAGLQMVYFVAYHLLGLAGVVVWHAWRRRWSAVRAGVLAGSATVAVAGFLNVDTLRVSWREGRNPAAVQRGPKEAAHFGLWPEQLVLPTPFHRLAWLREAVAPYARKVGSRGEFPSASLGVAGAAGLLGVVLTGLWRRRGAAGRAAAMVGWLAAWTVPIGVLALLGRAGGASLLRSNNRVSVVLLVLGLLWVAQRLTAWSAHRPRWGPGGAAAGLVAFGVFDQEPRSAGNQDPGRTASAQAQFDSARLLMAPLEGAQIFVFPPMPFPEGGGATFEDGSLPLQLHVVSRTARLSFGGVRGRPAGDWPGQVAALPPDAFVAAVREAGFTALVTHRSACDVVTCEARLAQQFGGLPGARRVDGGASGWFGWTWR